ncbi:MAG: lysine transporter LysE [Deltaproteobacteria bacterium RIFOXYD12_FULL_57_12]|nr:MAG: lysine transporter LysE [Deltaproteobacteria bacterium RIFOXYD12_FULL_57_12]
MTLLTIFFTSFMLALSGAMMPGPLLTATISESARRGFVAGPLLILGHGLLEFALVILLLLGLAPLLSHSEVFIGIALAGAGILAWLGIGMLRSLPTLKLSWQAADQGSGAGNLVAAGVLLSLANPYWTVWWVTIGLGSILSCLEIGPLGVAFFFAGHISADLAWYALVSAAVGRGRALLTDRLYRGIIGVCGVFLLGFAVYFLYAGLRAWEVF